MCGFNHKVITYVASLLKTPQLNLCSQLFPGIRESIVMHSFIKGREFLSWTLEKIF